MIRALSEYDQTADVPEYGVTDAHQYICKSVWYGMVRYMVRYVWYTRLLVGWTSCDVMWYQSALYHLVCGTDARSRITGLWADWD